MNHLLSTKQELQQAEVDSESTLATPLDMDEIQTVAGAPDLVNEPEPH